MADVRSGLDPADYHLIKEKPDPDFSPERNKAIIEDSIRKTDKFFATEGRVMQELTKERLDILSSYAVYRFNRGTKTFLDYYGKEAYHKLVGEKIMSKVRVAETVNRLNGNTRLKKGILL